MNHHTIPKIILSSKIMWSHKIMLASEACLPLCLGTRLSNTPEGSLVSVHDAVQRQAYIRQYKLVFFLWLILYGTQPRIKTTMWECRRLVLIACRHICNECLPHQWWLSFSGKFSKYLLSGRIPSNWISHLPPWDRSPPNPVHSKEKKGPDISYTDMEDLSSPCGVKNLSMMRVSKFKALNKLINSE